MSPIDIGPSDGRFGRNYRKKGRNQYAESSAADLDSEKTGRPPPDPASDAGPFSKDKCLREDESLAGKAKKGQQKASQKTSTPQKKKKPAAKTSVLPDKGTKVLKEAVKEGISAAVISDKVKTLKLLNSDTN